MRIYRECYIQKFEIIEIENHKAKVKIEMFDIKEFVHFFGFVIIDDMKNFIFETFEYIKNRSKDLAVGININDNMIRSIELINDTFVNFIFDGEILRIEVV